MLTIIEDAAFVAPACRSNMYQTECSTTENGETRSPSGLRLSVKLGTTGPTSKDAHWQMPNRVALSYGTAAGRGGVWFESG